MSEIGKPGSVRQGRGGKRCGRGFGSGRRSSPAELLEPGVQRAGDDGKISNGYGKMRSPKINLIILGANYCQPSKKGFFAPF